MAGKLSSFFPKLSNRAYAAAAASPKSSLEYIAKQETKVSKVANGITVASLENYSPVSQLAIMVKAGSANEEGSNIGITHFLRNCAGLHTKNKTAFGITRNIQQLGGDLTVSASREYMIYNLTCIRDHTEFLSKFLAEVTCRPSFHFWQIKDFAPRMKYDLAIYKQNPEAVLMEELHKAAFKGGLSNSLYCAEERIGQHKSEMLFDFVNKNFTNNGAAVLGIGVDHQFLEDFTTDYVQFSESRQPSGVPSKYKGGESRCEQLIPNTYVAIAAEGGGGLKNATDAISLALLQQILGIGPRVHYSADVSKLGEAAAKASSEHYVTSCINAYYADTGLFGFYVAGPPKGMGAVTKAVVKQMRDVLKKVSDNDVATAKHKLKAYLAMYDENQENLIEEIGLQTLFFGQVVSPGEADKMIDNVSAQDVCNVANRLLKCKPSMAAVGQLYDTPYLEDFV